MSMVAQDFLRRVERIPAHGLGLSADIFELAENDDRFYD